MTFANIGWWSGAVTWAAATALAIRRERLLERARREYLRASDTLWKFPTELRQTVTVEKSCRSNLGNLRTIRYEFSVRGDQVFPIGIGVDRLDPHESVDIALDEAIYREALERARQNVR